MFKNQDPRNCQFQFLLYWKPCFSSSPKGAPHGWCRRASVKEISREYLKFKAWTSATFQQCAWVRLLIAARGTLGLPPSSIHFVHYPTGRCINLWSFEPTSAHLRCTLASSCCWFAWTLWIPGVDSLKLLALIDCTSQSHFPLLPASDSFDMATSAPLLGAEKKGGHSKASIFYGADEYLEDVPCRAHWCFVNLDMFDEAAKLGHSPSIIALNSLRFREIVCERSLWELRFCC